MRPIQIVDQMILIIVVIFSFSCQNPEIELEEEEESVSISFVGHDMQNLTGILKISYKREVLLEKEISGTHELKFTDLVEKPFYQITFIRTGYTDSVHTLKRNELVSSSNLVLPILRVSETLKPAFDARLALTRQYHFAYDWMASDFPAYELMLDEETKSANPAESLSWAINTLEGPELHIDSSGVIGTGPNQTGRYIISINDSCDLFLEMNEVKHNPGFDDLVSLFEYEGKIHRGNDFSVGNLTVAFASKDSLGPGVNGRAFHFNESDGLDKVILLEPMHWNSSSVEEKECLFFHEAGHAVLYRIGHGDVFINNYPISVMNFPKPVDDMYFENRQYYMAELFLNEGSAEYVESVNEFTQFLETYGSTQIDMQSTGLYLFQDPEPAFNEDTIRLLYAKRNGFQSDYSDVSYTVTCEIGGETLVSRPWGFGVDAFGGSGQFGIDDVSHLFTKGEILEVTINVDSNQTFNDQDWSNNSRIYEIVWPW